MTAEKRSPGSVRARALAHELLIMDGHIDLPYRALEHAPGSIADYLEAVARGRASGDFDLARARDGGLDAAFQSIYVPARLQTEGGARAHADRLIDLVEALVALSPDALQIARTPSEVRASFDAGRIALPLGIENGAALEDDLHNLEHFHERGVRYITLTHSDNNLIGDSSYAERPRWSGLSPFGEQVVRGMNRLGIMVDVAHVSDATLRAVLEISTAPVIASHSSCRHFTPGFERNLSDELIRAIASRGGVILINFGSGFVKQEAREHDLLRWQARRRFREAQNLSSSDPKLEAFDQQYLRDHPPVRASLEDVADHFDHVRSLVGVDHLGFGSDFDGVGDSLPQGLGDVGHYPQLIEVLLRRGYSESDLRKICGENFLRVWQAAVDRAEGSAARSTASSPPVDPP